MIEYSDHTMNYMKGDGSRKDNNFAVYLASTLKRKKNLLLIPCLLLVPNFDWKAIVDNRKILIWKRLGNQCLYS